MALQNDGRDRGAPATRVRRSRAALIAAVAIAGCGHSRTSYRPVYTLPAPVSTPCTNCGPGRP